MRRHTPRFAATQGRVGRPGRARGLRAAHTRYIGRWAPIWATEPEAATQGHTRAHLADVHERVPGALRHVANVPRIRLARSAPAEGCVSAHELEVRP